MSESSSLRRLYDELATLPPDAREARLKAVREAQPRLGEELAALLARDESTAPHRPEAPPVVGDRSADPLGLIGKEVSHFRVLEPLGTGGMAVLYLAEDLRLGRVVALKFPAPNWSADPTAKRRFLREARAAATLDHPNICAVYEAGETDDGLLFLAMPHYEGETLRQRLSRGALPVREAVRIASRVARGLARAHQAGIVHRDIKPANLMLTTQGEVKILDFGVAKLSDATVTGSGGTPGTVAYMAPEQLRNDDVDARTDLWALGVVLYEMLTGRRPFTADHPLMLLRLIEERRPEPPRALRPDVPPEIEAVVLRLLAKRPEERFANAGELLAALEDDTRTGSGRRVSNRVGDTLRPVAPLVARIRERKLVQWCLGYLAFGGISIQGMDIVADTFSWPPVVMQSVIVLVVSGLPLVLILGWYHGEKGRQRVSLLESVLLGVVVLGAGAAVSSVGASPGNGLLGEPGSGETVVDTARYAIIPADLSPDLPDIAELLRERLASWSGITVVPSWEVQDALELGGRRDHGASVQRAALALGAGRYLRVEATPVGDSIRVHVTLHEARSDSVLTERTERVPTELVAARRYVFFLADSLMIGGTLPAARSGGSIGTTSLPARRAYERGHEALLAWDLSMAAAEFRTAVDHDAEYAQALTWLAQVQNWLEVPSAQWVSAAKRADVRKERLSATDSLHAEALAALAEGQVLRACSTWAELKELDSADFAGWYGWASCLSRDGVVVKDSSSPTGWRFRTSYHQALEAYRQAFHLLPSIYRSLHSGSRGRIQKILKTTSRGAHRRGRPLPPDTGSFMAYPVWQGDTIAFLPLREAQFASADVTTRSAAVDEAILRQRQLYHDLVAAWRNESPDTPEVLEALALSLDLLGDRSSIDTVRQARGLVDRPSDRVRLASLEVWMRVKYAAPSRVADLAAARALADSVLTTFSDSVVAEPLLLASLAALTGQAALAASYARAGSSRSLPRSVADVVPSLVTFAAMGGPPDSLRVLEREAERALGTAVLSSRRSEAVQQLARAVPLALSVYDFPYLSAEADSADYMIQLVRAWREGDATRARAVLEHVRRVRNLQGLSPSEIAPEALYAEAWVLSALGDDAAAIAWLDPALRSMSMMPTETLADAVQGALLVRSMALHAVLAGRTGDEASAQSWSRAALALWGGGVADEYLSSVLKDLEQLAR